MATAPYGIRLLVGAATAAVEETIRLPRTILMYPMTLASHAAHVVMRLQQSLAELAIKGDSTLDMWFPPKDEQPEWATFDEDLVEIGDQVPEPGSEADTVEGERRPSGRFALYSTADTPGDSGEPGAGDAPTEVMRVKRPAKTAPSTTAPTPAVADELDYEALTLAQLRARLQSLDVSELEALLAYEEATKARPPFQTLLANRIARAR